MGNWCLTRHHLIARPWNWPGWAANYLICTLIGYHKIRYIDIALLGSRVRRLSGDTLCSPDALLGCCCFCVVCCLLCHFILGVLEQMFMFVYLCMRASVSTSPSSTHTHTHTYTGTGTGMPVYCGWERVISAVVSVCWSAFVWLISITKPAQLTCYHNWRTKLKILCRRQNKAETENCDHNTSLQRLWLCLWLLPKWVGSSLAPTPFGSKCTMTANQGRAW